MNTHLELSCCHLISWFLAICVFASFGSAGQSTAPRTDNRLTTPHMGASHQASAAESPVTPDIENALKQIRPEAIRAHMTFLADDALEGRGTGTRGYDLGAKYLRSQLIACGIGGGTKEGAYFQKVPLVRTSVDAAATTMNFGTGKPLQYEKDFLLLDTHGKVEGGASAKAAFVGYGVTAPELGYDDYSGLDVRGCIVVLLDSEAPPSFPPTIRAYYSDHDVKMANVAQHGAIGALYVSSVETARRFPWDFYVRELQIGWNSLRWVSGDQEPGGLQDQIQVAGMLNRTAAEMLFAGEEHEFTSILDACEKGVPPRFALSKTVSVRYRARHQRIECTNVVGRLEGSDATLRKEYVVYTAHADHLGIGPAVDGDSIYNGALDNASGCAVLLEVARAFTELRQRPARSILFVMVTAEEAGLLGSDYFVQNPPVPIGSIVANINLDGAIPLTPVTDVVAHGAEHSTIGATVRQAGRTLDIAVSPDPFPEEGMFVRADQYSFVKRGIPSLFLETGVTSGTPDVDALALLKNWLVTKYHSPQDDLGQPFEYETGAQHGRFAFLVGHTLATELQRPGWNDGDFFGSKFGRRSD